MSVATHGALTYLDEGSPDGEVVLLLHGWPTSSFLWRRLVPLLAARFRVLVPELEGTDLRAQADEVGAVLRALRVERFAVVGHSHGGAVAQLLAHDGIGLQTLVLIDSVAFDEAPPTDLDPRTFVERGTVEVADLTDDELAALTSAHGPPPGPVDLADAVATLSDAEYPVFLLWGEDDPYTPLALAERLNDALPGSTLGVVPESGHFLLEDAFDSVGVLLAEYLRSRYLGAPHGHEGIVALQLERRPPWVDLAPYMEEDDDPAPPRDQEVGPNA
ncbi:MAG TPA: alpha/beta fold hydrolase [Actinomycetota bacterium]